MSRGPGRTQQRILAELRGRGRVGVAELADHLGLDARQTRRAVQSLAERGLVHVHSESTRLTGGRHAPVKQYVWVPKLTPEQRRALTQSVRDFATPPPVGRVVTASRTDIVAENRAAMRRKLAPKPSEPAKVIDLDERRK